MKYDAISVTDLNKYIKDKIANDEALNNVLVKGEISNFKNQFILIIKCFSKNNSY